MINYITLITKKLLRYGGSMNNLKIGVMVESFRLSTYDGIAKAAEVGARGIQMYTLRETHPDQLSKLQRKNLLEYIKSFGLVVSALCGDFGGFGLEKAKDNSEKIRQIKQAIELAVDLETSIVTTHIGTIPVNDADPVYRTLFAACAELAKYAERVGITFAIETGPEASATLKKFIEAINSIGIGVNFDPANLRMVTGEEAVYAAENLKKYIVHIHAKDGIQLRKIEPVIIYHYFAGENPDNINIDDYFKEVPLGTGQVDFPGFVNVLQKSGYDGFYTIEREVGENPVRDIKEAVSFLQKM
jgi:sugar phosphate isomerase/epimerase